MTIHTVIKRLVAAPALTVAVAACGAASSEAPTTQAMKLSVATSGISTACGLAYQSTAFPRDHRSDLKTLEATASASAAKLAGVYRRNPAWIYQGETVHDIVRDALSMLGACELTQAEHALLRGTAPS